jgi:hypothetical protein
MDVEGIVLDKAGNVWAGTLFDGALVYMGEEVRSEILSPLLQDKRQQTLCAD